MANRHAAAFSLDNEETAAFAKKNETANRLELLKRSLESAAVRPDVRPSEQGRAALSPQAEEPSQSQPIEATPPPALAPVEVHPQPEPIQERPQEQIQENSRPSPSTTASPTIEDHGMSYSLPQRGDDNSNRGGRPRHGAERKVERTISMDKSLDKIILHLSIIESVRLGRRVSSAEVAVHFMKYGLSHMKDNQVLPGDDGLGLQITMTAPITVALPKLSGKTQ